METGIIEILHSTPEIGQRSFGLGQVTLNLAREQDVLGCDTRIWCVSSAGEIQWASTSMNFPENRIRSFSTVGPHRLAYSPAMERIARSSSCAVDIVHQHGIWTGCSQVSNIFRKKHGVPVVVAPHGSLDHWALKRSRWKKELALRIYERENLMNSACLHATAEEEITDFRDFGLRNPIAIIPNGISETWLEMTGSRSRFLEQYSIPKNRKILFFLSRITPKKGLPILLDAIDRNRDAFTNWLLVIAGTDEFNHLREVKQIVADLGLSDLVKFLGPLFDQEKRDAFAASDVFVLPSHSEGAPMVVLDSLATGVPVITTKVTPWENLHAWKCGWWVDASIDGLSDALNDMLNQSGDSLKLMGQRGRDLVRNEYLWKVQGIKTVYLYEWLLGRRSKPDFVVVD